MKVAPLILGIFVALLLASQLLLGLLMLSRTFFGTDISGVLKTHLIVGNTSVILSIVYILFSLSAIWSSMNTSQKTTLTVLGVLVTLLLLIQFVIGLFFGIGVTPALLISHLIIGNLSIFLGLIYVWHSLSKILSMPNSM